MGEGGGAVNADAYRRVHRVNVRAQGESHGQIWAAVLRDLSCSGMGATFLTMQPLSCRIS